MGPRDCLTHSSSARRRKRTGSVFCRQAAFPHEEGKREQREDEQPGRTFRLGGLHNSGSDENGENQVRQRTKYKFHGREHYGDRPTNQARVSAIHVLTDGGTASLARSQILKPGPMNKRPKQVGLPNCGVELF
jgi:hypothetical protein